MTDLRPDDPQPVTPPPTPPSLEDRVSALEQQVAQINQRISGVKVPEDEGDDGSAT